MNSPNNSLSFSETRKLTDFLQSNSAPANTLTFHQLQGFLFNICCTPVLLPPSQWLPVVFGGGALDFESVDDAWVFEALMRVYNEINIGVVEGCSRLPVDCQLVSGTSDNFNPPSALHEWCHGFNLGIVLTADIWDETPISDDLRDEIDHLWMLLSFFADEASARESKVEKGVTPEFEDALPLVFELLPELIEDYAAIGRMLYLESLDEETEDSDFGTLEDDEARLIDSLLDAAENSDDPKKKTAFAKAALELDPNCVDALLIMAHTLPPKDRQHMALLEKAVALGEQEFGQDYFTENTGHFWGLIETRPYMRALAGLADACRQNGMEDRSIALYEKALELNPGDNQGLRFYLMTAYLEQRQLEKCDALFAQFDEDGTAFFRYSRALLSYIREGDSASSRSLKKDARSYNSYVPRLLSGRLKMPRSDPDYFSPGEKNEAVLYVRDSQNLWRSVQGSIPWVLKKD